MNSNTVFVIFVLVLMIPFIALVIRMTRSQHRYLNLYKQAHPTIELPEGSNDPAIFFGQLGRVGNTLNAYKEVQQDPDLERARQEVAWCTRMTFIWGFGCPVVFFVVATVFKL